MRNLKIFFGALVVALLTACGGGGGSAGTTSTGTSTSTPATATATSTTTPSTSTTTTTTTTTVTTVASAADFVFELDKATIQNTGSDKAVLSVLTVDKNNNVVSGVPVSVSLDSGVFSGASGTSSDTNGKFSGNITIGGNKTNRVINAKITVNGIVKVASIVVTGSLISVTPIPATPSPLQAAALNLSSLDGANAAISGVKLAVTGTALPSTTVTTDLSGSSVISYVAPATAGTYTVVVTGLGVSTTKIIQVVNTGSSSFLDAVGPISSASLSPQPTSISPNASGVTTNRAKLSAKFLTTGNTGIERMRVRFELVAPFLGNGEAISTGDSVVYSDTSGNAEAYYISGTRSSPTNGVTVRACYSLVDFTTANPCPNAVVANLTVAGSPLSITIGDDNLLEKGLGNIAYVKKFLIQVNDSAGVAVADAIVTGSVDITHYGKGASIHRDNATTFPRGSSPPTGTKSYAAISTVVGTATVAVVSTTIAVSPSAISNIFYNAWCANEDLNRNGFLDAGEDTNGNLSIEPRKAEIIVSYVNGNKTDSNGQLLLQVSYAQNVGGWLAYRLRATTSVAGSEGDASKAYITDVVLGDVSNGSFLTPPYGTSSCSSAN